MSQVDWIIKQPQPRGFVPRLVAYLKSHPILFLILLTPGIPEYLSASSNLTGLVVGLPVSLLFLAANVGLYGSGVLLIREAMIRWKKGWASVFLLGIAYGILEEGIDVWTFFYSKAGPVGNLGFYGHYLGVNWVWAISLAIFHSVFSIGLPIFLFGLAMPELKSKTLLSNSGIRIVLVTIVVDSILLFDFVSQIYAPYTPGVGLVLSSIVAITLLVLLAHRLPGDFLKTRSGQPKWRPTKFAVAGALFFPATFLTGGISAGANLPPEIPFALDLFLALFILMRAFKAMGSANNQEQKVALGIGLLIPIAAFGFIAGLGQLNVLIVLADMLFVLFSRRLWRKWRFWTMHQLPMQPFLDLGKSSSPTLSGS